MLFRSPFGPRSQCGEMAWIETGSPAADSLSALVHNSKLIKDMKRCCAVAVGDTSDSLLNHYCRKVTQVRLRAMLSRILAVMDFSKNSVRPQAVSRNSIPINVKAMQKCRLGEASERSI